MALFSDNPFVGAFRSQQRRAQEEAMAQQQAIAQQQQQQQEFSGKRLEQLRSIPSDIRGLEAMRRSNELYSFGGGSIGGVWQKNKTKIVDPATGGLKEIGYQLKPQYMGVSGPLDPTVMAQMQLQGNKKKPIVVLPVGTMGRQEDRGLIDAAKARGIPYVEAPEKFVRGKGTSQQDRASQFYSTVTGRPMGTLLGRGAYGGFGAGKEGKPQPTQISQGFGNISPRKDAALTEATKVTQGEMGVTGKPIGFTGFGQTARTQAAEQTVSPIGEGFGQIGANLFGAPRYPFAGARSAFERGIEQSSATVGVPRFPFAGYDQPYGKFIY